MAALLAALVFAFPHGTATITTPHGRVAVSVEIAQTAPAWERGLMYRRRLAAHSGMIFVFPSASSGGFWMKHTLIPLSIAFYNSAGRILRILDMTPCRSDPCEMYDPGIAYRGALEVNRGEFRRWGVRAGDRITLRRGG
jgi:uncharacterized membrane protein (UPF0127 family)